MNKVSNRNHPHEGVLERKSVSFEPIETYFVPNYSEILFSNPLMTLYQAVSANTSDDNIYSIQKIEKVPNSSSEFWIRRWNYILEMSRADNQGILTYFACHIEKNAKSDASTIYLVSEYAANTLRAAKDSLHITLADLIRGTFQVSEALLHLKNQGYFHRCINSDTIFVLENKDGTRSYKLANLGAWMKTHEVEYKKRAEYIHLIPQDYDPQNKNSTDDVYALGITIMEVVGVNIDTLMNHKTQVVDPKYVYDSQSLPDKLIKFLLEAVHPNSERRLSLENFRDRLKVIIENQGALEKLEYHTFYAGLESLPLVPYQNHADLFNQKEQLSMFNMCVNNPIEQITEKRKEDMEREMLIVNPASDIQAKLPPEDLGNQKNFQSPGVENNIVKMVIKPPNETQSSSNTSDIIIHESKSRYFKLLEIDCKCWGPLCVIFLWILGIALFLFQYAMSIAIMVNFGPGVVSPGDVAGGALGIYQNLGVGPISDIAFTGTCPSGYDMLDLGNWPGTVSFCYDSGYVQTDYDDFDYGASECTNVYSGIDSQVYTIWNNTEVCVKRITQVSNYSTCPLGYVQCYTGVCAYGTDCGITEIQIENTVRTDPGWYSTPFNSMYANYRKDVGVIPISSFTLSQGQPTPCLNPNEYSAQVNYDAIAPSANGCGRYGSFPNITQLDSDTSINIIGYQPWGDLPLSLPKFTSEIGSQQGYFMAIARLEINNLGPCLTFNLQTFLDGSNELNSSSNVTSGFIITIMVLLGIATIVSGAIYYVIREAKILLTILGGTLVLIAILTIPVAAVTAKMNRDLATFQQDLSTVADSRCFVDSSAQQVFSDFMSTSAVATTVVTLWKIYAIVSWIGGIVLGICFFIYTTRISS